MKEYGQNNERRRGAPQRGAPQRGALKSGSPKKGAATRGDPIRAPTLALQTLKTGDDCAKALDALPGIFDEVVPLNLKHRQELGRTIRSLWEDLTSEREHRAAEYLSAPAYYSAYVRYFLPWNIIRLSSIFASLPLELDEGASIIDIGSGPLTVPIALYVARPELRSKALTIYCTDKTERILKVGQTIFESLCARMAGVLPPWKIVLSRQPFGSHLAEKADLLTAANVFNEFFWKGKTPLGMRALLTAKQLLGYLKGSGSIFLMEPGDPRSGSFISATRAALSAFGAEPIAPCPHTRACPMPGIFRGLETPSGDPPSGADTKPLDRVVMPKRRDKYPWCHFTIGTERVPAWMKALSEEAGLPKEKLVFSYLLSAVPGKATSPAQASADSRLIRVVSEEFPLPGCKAGRYACSAEGYCLIRYTPAHTSFSSGDLVRFPQAISEPPARGTSAAQAGERVPIAKPRFADALESRFLAAPKAPHKPLSSGVQNGKALDEKSGAIIVSY